MRARRRQAAAAQLRGRQRPSLLRRSAAILIERNIIARKDEMSMDRIREWMERNPEEGRGAAAAEQVLCVLPRNRPAGATRSRSARRACRSRPAARSRSTASCTSTARRSSSRPICRSRAEAGHQVPPPDDRAGHRRRDRRAGARRHLFRRRRRGRPASPGRLRHDGRFVMLVPKELVSGRRPMTRFRCRGAPDPRTDGRIREDVAKEEARPNPKPTRRQVQNEAASRRARRPWRR